MWDWEDGWWRKMWSGWGRRRDARRGTARGVMRKAKAVGQEK